MQKSPVFILVFGFCIAIAARTALAQSGQPDTKNGILSDLTKEINKFDGVLEEMTKKHAVAVHEARDRAVEQLRAIAKSQAGQGEIATATETWADLLILDPEDAEAKQFFASIDRLDIVQKIVNRNGNSKSRNQQIQRIVWQGENGTIVYRRPDGAWVERAPAPEGKEPREEVYSEVSRNDYSIELFRRSGLSRFNFLICADHVMWKHKLDKNWSIISSGQWVR
ncbi:hypothetical protein GC197_04425 [bacterium]|nr:hypothetical protein [bacterium]